MSTQANVIIHEIATDGLPDMDALTGRVAFIFDGCIVSGWPLGVGDDGEGSYSGYWEADSDVGRQTKFASVTHWVEFPAQIWNLAAPTSPSEPVPSTPRVPGSTERPEGISAVQYGYRYRAEGRTWTRTWKCKDRDEAESLVAHVRGEGAADAEVMTRIVESWRPLTEVEEKDDAD